MFPCYQILNLANIKSKGFYWMKLFHKLLSNAE